MFALQTCASVAGDTIIGENSIITPNSLVPQGQQVPEESVWLGVPGQCIGNDNNDFDFYSKISND